VNKYYQLYYENEELISQMSNHESSMDIVLEIGFKQKQIENKLKELGNEILEKDTGQFCKIYLFKHEKYDSEAPVLDLTHFDQTGYTDETKNKKNAFIQIPTYLKKRNEEPQTYTIIIALHSEINVFSSSTTLEDLFTKDGYFVTEGLR
jgi:hypothetical protein